MNTLARSDKSWSVEWWRTVDQGVITGALVLLACGMLLSLAAGPTAAARIGYDNPFHFVYRHAFFVSLSIVVLLLTSMLSDVWAWRASFFVFLGSFLLMAAILVVGYEAKGSQRWIRIAGFSLQPSEFVKPSLVVVAAWLLARRQQSKTVPWTLIAFLLFAPTAGLLLLQPDI